MFRELIDYSGRFLYHQLVVFKVYMHVCMNCNSINMIDCTTSNKKHFKEMNSYVGNDNSYKTNGLCW